MKCQITLKLVSVGAALIKSLKGEHKLRCKLFDFRFQSYTAVSLKRNHV